MAARADYLPSEMTATEGAAALGVTNGLISQWVTAGLLAPFGKRGRSPLYHLSDLLGAANERNRDLSDILPRVPEAVRREMREAAGDVDESAPDYAVSRARRETANAELAELNLAERKGEMLRASVVRHAIGSSMVAVRERILAIETRSHGQMTAGAHAWLAAELRTALAEATDNAERIMGEHLGEPVDDD
jgi:hypothetical protein